MCICKYANMSKCKYIYIYIYIYAYIYIVYIYIVYIYIISTTRKLAVHYVMFGPTSMCQGLQAANSFPSSAA